MKRFLKFICLVLLAAMLIPSISACGIVTGDTVMEYEGYEITEAMYSYWVSHFKAAFVNTYGEIDANGKRTVDWSEILPDGSTYESFFEDQFVIPYAKKVLISMKLFDDYDLSISDDVAQSIAERIEGIIGIYGDEKGFNNYLANYGLNVKTLERIYYAEAKVDIVNDYIFGSGGPAELTATEKQNYYNENYYCVNWIYIFTEKKPSSSEQGTNLDGSYILTEMTDEEKAEKRALVAEIVEKLESGEKTFAELKKDYCEDKNDDGTSKYDYLPNGFNLCANDYSVYGVDLISLIQGMEIDEVKTLDDAYGGTRIIIRNELIPFASLTTQEYNFMNGFESYVMGTKWDKMITDANITVYSEVVDRYDVKTTNPFANTAI